MQGFYSRTARIIYLLFKTSFVGVLFLGERSYFIMLGVQIVSKIISEYKQVALHYPKPA